MGSVERIRAALPPESDWGDLIARYDRPLPRYTSYPTAPACEHDAAYARDRILAADEPRDAERALALYVHVPFCPSLCWYCACNRLVTKDAEIADRYLDAVAHELDGVAARTGMTAIRWLHWGGGTPNSLSDEQVVRLFRAIEKRFRIDADAEISIELDPRLVSREQMRLLASLGFNRVSFGVQDIQEATQRAINRMQTLEQTRSVVQWARDFEIAGVNIDLIYGLPRQTLASFARTVRQVLAMRPDRVAAYAYAHVPWVNRAQRVYEDSLPDRVEKFGMIVDSVHAFTDAGYRHIGIDHFAAPADALARADLRDAVSRTFMGYTARRTDTTIGVGASAISASRDAFAQNQPDVARYIQAVADGKPASRGCLLSHNDIERRSVIESIMTQGRISMAEALGLLVDGQALAPLERDGLVRIEGDTLALTALGRLFARNVASCFDSHLAPAAGRHASAV